MFIKKLQVISQSSEAGLTLLELMVAVSLFVVVMLISTTMFLRSIDSQSRAVTSKNLQEGLNYALAIMATEAGGAIQDPHRCNVDTACSDTSLFFCSINSGTELIFRNSSSQCVDYKIQNDGANPRILVNRGGASAYLTPTNVKITSLKFNIGNTNDATYPIGEATLFIGGQSLVKENYPDTLNIQTTVATWPAE